MKKTKFLILFILLSLNVLYISAQKQIEALAIQARDFYIQNFNEIKTPVYGYDLEGNQQNFIVSFEEGGYIFLHKKGAEYIVLSVIPQGDFNPVNNLRFGNLPELITYPIDASKLPEPPSLVRSQSNILTDVPNFMTNEWGSVNCYDDQGNLVNVTNYYTPNNCSAGCVAISTSQILHYYKWPRIGVGSNIYSDYYNGSLVRHGAFFDKEPYDWANMLDQYMYAHSTETQRKAAGKLVYDVAVAVEMNFEPSGSSSNVNKVPFILENYFRYTGDYHSIGWSSFWSKMYSSMQERIPVALPVEDSAGNGHAMVASGYKYMNGAAYYYINWGWYNSGSYHNGWENLQGWDSSTTGYNTLLGGLFNVVPEPEITSITPTGNGNDFTVHWEVAQNVNWEEFTLQQKVDNGTWQNLATGLTTQDYTVTNPTGNVYVFRVKAKSHGGYYLNSYSEQVAYAPVGGYDGYGSFEGSQYCYTKQGPDYPLIFNHDYTFETWINVRSGNQNGDVIFSQNNIFSFEIKEVTSNDYSVVFKSPASQDELNSNATGPKLQINHWHHIAVSKEGQTARLFIDGVLRDEDANNHFNLFSSNTPFNIGERYTGSYSGYIKAYFDEIRFSDIARYTSNFTPNRRAGFTIDDHTKGYFKFQNVHRNRLKDEVYKMSYRVKNEAGKVRWKFEYDPAMNLDELEQFQENIKVYPNPTTDFIAILDKSNKIDWSEYTFQILDLSGKQIDVSIQQKEANHILIDVCDIPPGQYILLVKNQRYSASLKIIKK